MLSRNRKLRIGAFISTASTVIMLSAFSPGRPRDDATVKVTVYKSPYCGCCSKWVDHLKSSGFTVETVDVDDVMAIKTRYGVPQDLASCHTAVVNGRIIEGHVPADLVKRFLQETTGMRGLAVPGMPVGSPGMEGLAVQAYNVIAFDKGGRQTIYARR